MNQKEIVPKLIFLLTAAACLTPWIEPPVALFMGIVLSQVIGHPYEKYNNKATSLLLKISVVGLGFGMNAFEAAKAGKQGILFTVASISLTLIIGLIAGRLMVVGKKTSILISTGTAICGGSAIAAVAPVIGAKENEISVSLATVFILNSIALVLFPLIGLWLHLSQSQFGLWAAIAIHDTSSVVGAAHKFGAQALQIATTVKLERALWIIPVSFIMAIAFKSSKNKVKLPWFILFFVLAMLANTFLPKLLQADRVIVLLAKRGLTLTLFLIGAGLTREALKTVSFRPMILGVFLWVLISLSSLFVILHSIS
ncbi:MAG: putative sulfate exporter family transporter [Bacteroidetes bacterium]|nr:putative sulfate exporter family transporter [Bacteroidota bacterium]